jgi:hypothetical protein
MCLELKDCLVEKLIVEFHLDLEAIGLELRKKRKCYEGNKYDVSQIFFYIHSQSFDIERNDINCDIITYN